MFWSDRHNRVRAISLGCACVLGVLGFLWGKESSPLWFACVGQSFQAPDDAVIRFNKYAYGTEPQYWLSHKRTLDGREDDDSTKPALLPKRTLLMVERARVNHPDMGYSKSYIARLPDGRMASFKVDEPRVFPKGSLPERCDQGTRISAVLHGLTFLMAAPFLLLLLFIVTVA